MTRALAVTLLVAAIFVAIGIGSAAVSQRALDRPVIGVACVDDEQEREKIRTIMLAAIDDALKQHIIRMTDTWMRDETDQPQRAINGATRGIKAFIGSRRQALKWNPPICSEGAKP